MPSGGNPGLDTPIAVTSWNWLLKLNAYDADQIRSFFRQHVNNGPEQVGLRDYSGEFHALYVLKVGQGQGLGTRLMTTMAAALTVRGMTAATVWALRDNWKARRFYEKMGGKLVSDRPLTFDGTQVMEVAYGWGDITPLARRSEEVWR